MNIKVSFTDQDWQRIERDWSDWWAGELERPLLVIEGWDSFTGGPPPVGRQFATNFPLTMPADAAIDYLTTPFIIWMVRAKFDTWICFYH